jgi:hypothetical protein
MLSLRRVAMPALLALSALALPVRAQDVGSVPPAFELEDFGLTEAASLDDYVGRAVLIEFFAHW